ncbi:ATP-dependent Clp protease ATP-binding subunit [Treponema primitia]|uniref:ATP-dependent Clp protease ATP-binding subunit n=1 Tax=Treponema primitia TaxID=88058 RepID=UPI0002554D1D|nr:ATP-dependent Clp protease ATP-binding subunit [Treponema primitia]
MSKGLTQRAHRILTIDAQEEARHFNSDQLLPEHVIIALLKDGAGIACKALMFLRIDLLEFRHTLENEITRMSGVLVFGDVPPSKRTRTMLENAAEETRSMGNDYIGTEHLLFAAMREQDSPVQLYLNQRAVDTDMLRVVVQTTFNHGNSGQESEFFSAAGTYMGNADLYQPNFLHQSSKESRSHSNRAKSASYPPLSSTPTLDEYSRDLTALAKQGKLDPVINRRKEIGRAVRILARRTKNNPVLVGEPGVGKTAIVEGLAQLFSEEDIPEMLAGKRILSLDLGSVVAGTKYRGEFEERLKKIMKEIAAAKNVILFIDEIHTIIGAGGAEGTIDASNMLKPALSRGDIQCIGATTLAEYRKHFEKDAALERRFQAVQVDEPGLEETLNILKGIQKKYEDHHRVSYTPESVSAAARLAQRYIVGRFMPDKAIDILDEAGAMRKLEAGSNPPEISDIETEIQQLSDEKNALVSIQDYERAAGIRDRVRNLRLRLESVRDAWERSSQDERTVVSEGDIRRVVAETTGIPLTRLEEQESRRLLKIEEELHKEVVGQDEAVRRISSAIRRSRAGISSPKRPLGSFIFLGPTGVGKTLLAKRLSEYLFGNEDSLVRIDMSDYMEKHNASRLVGAPPGYVGYEEGGVLTERIRRNPYRVVLFDEIEKAHHDIFNLLLQVLEEGELKDNLGHTVNFRNTVIIMTSNAGVREISRDSRLGFSSETGIMDIAEIQSAAMAELRRLFNPEFINRVDDVVVFHALDEKQVESILELQVEELAQRLAEQGYSIEVLPAARKILIEKGWDPKYGGRPMRRAIQKELEDPLSTMLLEGNFPFGTVFIADGHDGKITVQQAPKAAGHPVPETVQPVIL